jgi:nucleotidyltransferase AbiEii toxin of type IV toxin-antitoxin system
MNLAKQIETLIAKGFSEQRAETVVVIREAAILLFDAFPDSFLPVGGTSLVLFHDSPRHSPDLDLYSSFAEFPKLEVITDVLLRGLDELARLLNLRPITTKALVSTPELIKIALLAGDETTLFTVDLGRIGSVQEAGIELRGLEAVSLDTKATIKSVSLNYLLLQKAEVFMLRKFVKARDAFDIHLLKEEGAALNEALEVQLETTLSWEEIDSEDNQNRIALIDGKRCRAELQPVLPDSVYEPHAATKFQPLRDALTHLFKRWL